MSRTGLLRIFSAVWIAIALCAPISIASAQEAPPVYLPIVRKSSHDSQFAGFDRRAATELYESHFLAPRGVSSGWTGNRANCNAGALSSAFSSATLNLVNYFRTAAGVPGITFDPGLSAKAQKAALMFSVNRSLSHSPPSNWRCYSAEGADAARHSNISLFYDSNGDSDMAGVLGQMEDFGSHNREVGHRRWLLLPQTGVMGMGHVPAAGSDAPGAGAMWVLPANTFSDDAASSKSYIAWPPPGYVPWQALYLLDPYFYEHRPNEYHLRWSFQLWDANFDGASVSLTLDGQALPTQVIAKVRDYNEAIVFVPALTYAHITNGSEHVAEVTIRNVVTADGTRRDFRYVVRIFDGGNGE